MSSGYEVAVAAPPEEHAFASPSKFKAICICPYTAHCCEGWDEPESEASTRGSLMHEAMYNDAILCSLEEDDQAIVRQMRETFIKPYEGMDIRHEVKVHVKDEDDSELTFGTIDLQIVFPDGSTIINVDFKFGNYPVTAAPENEQLWGYDLGTFQENPGCDTVFSMIAQPNMDNLSFVPMAKRTRKEDYADLLEKVRSIVTRARQATPEDANPDPDACRFCNTSACKACQKALMMALDNFAELSEEFPENLPSEQLRDWCDGKLQQVELAKQMLKALEGKLKPVIMAANGSAHYRVQTGRESKTTDWAAICKEYGITDEVVEAHTVRKMGEPFIVKRRK